MSKKHFERLARMVSDDLELLSAEDRHNVAVRLADVCQEFNHAFDRTRFLTACGVLR